MFSLFYGSMSAGIASPRPPAPCAPTERSHRTAADKKDVFSLGFFISLSLPFGCFFFLFFFLRNRGIAVGLLVL